MPSSLGVPDLDNTNLVEAVLIGGKGESARDALVPLGGQDDLGRRDEVVASLLPVVAVGAGLCD